MRFLVTTLTLLTLVLATAGGQANAGVSISVGEPGFYGRIDIGNFPAPRLVREQPIIVRPVKVWYPPIYLRVPPGHIKKWHRYCDRYNACGRPVYFIDDYWYRDVYVPRYRKIHHDRDTYHRSSPKKYKPEYYEYRKHPNKPAKKVYIKRKDYRDDHREWDDHKGRGNKR